MTEEQARQALAELVHSLAESLHRLEVAVAELEQRRAAADATGAD